MAGRVDVVSFLRKLARRGATNRGGALLIPRQQAGQINWPRCALCRRIVDAYGMANETSSSVEIWARCTGVLLDPSTGLAVHGAPKRHEMRADSVTIAKGPGWTHRRLTDAISRLMFFAPDGDRHWAQDLSHDGVHAKS